jgi:hypothetical protein
MNLWQQSFVPEVLMGAVRTLQVNGMPLVKQEGFLLKDEHSPVIPAKPLSLLVMTLPIGLVLGLAMPLLALTRQRRASRLGYGILMLATQTLCGLGGLVLLLGWVFTDHWGLWANHNLFLSNPLCWLMLPTAIASLRKGWVPTPRTLENAGFLALLAALTVPFQLLPNAQQQWPWIAVFLPLHMGTWLSLRMLAKKVA